VKTLAAPKAPPIIVSERQKKILSRITRQATAEFREVSRALLILEIEKGGSNSKTACTMGCSTPKVARWRKKWLENQDALRQAEEDSDPQEQLERAIRDVLKDRPRPGAPATYSSEEYCRILALALEPPEESGRPLSHWTAGELADECAIRGITSGISPRQIARFLKRN
jgi:hypothetical protein